MTLAISAVARPHGTVSMCFHDTYDAIDQGAS